MLWYTQNDGKSKIWGSEKNPRGRNCYPCILKNNTKEGVMRHMSLEIQRVKITQSFIGHDRYFQFYPNYNDSPLKCFKEEHDRTQSRFSKIYLPGNSLMNIFETVGLKTNIIAVERL